MNQTRIGLCFLGFIISLFVSCSKEEYRTHNFHSNNYKAIIDDWLNIQLKQDSLNLKGNLRRLAACIGSEEPWAESYTGGARLVIAPLSRNFEGDDWGPGVQSFLVLIQNGDGKIARQSIIRYQPKAGAKTVMKKNTFSQVFTYKAAVFSGALTVSSVYGEFRYMLSFDSGRLKSVKTRKSYMDMNRLMVPEGTQVQGQINCTDWYLVTTTFWPDGTTSETSEYIGRTCTSIEDPQVPQPPDGGNGEIGISYEYDEEYVVNASSDWLVTEIPAQLGNGKAYVTTYFSGRNYKNHPEKNKFVSAHTTNFRIMGSTWAQQSIGVTTTLSHSIQAKLAIVNIGGSLSFPTGVVYDFSKSEQFSHGTLIWIR